jgi:hypothetical protein
MTEHFTIAGTILIRYRIDLVIATDFTAAYRYHIESGFFFQKGVPVPRTITGTGNYGRKNAVLFF